MTKYKVVDLFAGVGGLSYGFAHDPVFDVIAANEILPAMAKAYELNHSDTKMYCKDIKDFGLADLEKDFGIKSGGIDIILGGPPCQAYSTVGKRDINDPRGKLFYEYYRVLKEVQPNTFIFENVVGLLSMNGGKLIRQIIELFETLGYIVYYKTLNAADYGVPQIRERVIIVGTKLKNKFIYPEPTHGDSSNLKDVNLKDVNLKDDNLQNGLFNDDNQDDNLKDDNLKDVNLKPYLTLGEAISDLPFISSNSESFEYSSEPQNDFQNLMRKDAPEKLQDHNSPNNNDKLVKIMESLPDGGTPNDLPEELRPSSGFANTYCRLWWNKPSTTITRNLGTPSSSRCIHPKAPRALTTREGARLQSFPDDYKFYGTRADRNLQIGNAVPVFLSQKIKDSVKELLR